MTIGRRGFLMAGSAAAGAGFIPASEVHATPIAGGRSVTDFGVEPNGDADQTEKLQKAIDEIAGAGQPILFPAGTYSAGKLSLRARGATIAGIPGLTQLKTDAFDVTIESDLRGVFTMSGMTIEGRASAAGPHLSVRQAYIRVTNCIFLGNEQAEPAIKLDDCLGSLEGAGVLWYSGSALVAMNSPVAVQACSFAGCGTGIETRGAPGISIVHNHFDKCDIGIAAAGDAIVTGNIVKGAKSFGMKLGRPGAPGNVLAQGNMLQDCRIGIGVASEDTEIFASLNMITGAKDGAIRAFDGDTLVGPDLAMESAEAYLNLTLVGNVTR